MLTILGSGGAIGNLLVRELGSAKEPVRLVSRHAQASAGNVQTVAADASDLSQTVEALAGSRIVFLLVGLRYELAVWREAWPRIMDNAIEASKRAGARLVFFDNVYMYGLVNGAMTEGTPFNPCSKKGEIRATIANRLLQEMKSGNLTALFARSADFYGPAAKTGIPNVMVFDNFAHGKPAYWMGNDSVPHSFTYTPDAARSLVTLAASDTAWNQTWHLPTAPDPPTGKQLIAMAAAEFGVRPRSHVLKRPVVKIAGWFVPVMRELGEMLYQYEHPYLFDSSKFSRAFGQQPTPYLESVRQTIRSYRS